MVSTELPSSIIGVAGNPLEKPVECSAPARPSGHRPRQSGRAFTTATIAVGDTRYGIQRHDSMAVRFDVGPKATTACRDTFSMLHHGDRPVIYRRADLSVDPCRSSAWWLSEPIGVGRNHERVSMTTTDVSIKKPQLESSASREKQEARNRRSQCGQIRPCTERHGMATHTHSHTHSHTIDVCPVDCRGQFHFIPLDLFARPDMTSPGLMN